MTLKLNQAVLAAFAVTFIAAWPLLADAQQTETRSRTYSYDTNGDGIIEQDEFTTYIYKRADTDADGYLADEEWKVTTSSYYRPYKDLNYNTHTYWDQDKDGRLDNNEMKTLIEKTGLYSKWDTNLDGKVDNAEFVKGTFNSYDDNNDGLLSMEEWKSVLN